MVRARDIGARVLGLMAVAVLTVAAQNRPFPVFAAAVFVPALVRVYLLTGAAVIPSAAKKTLTQPANASAMWGW